MGICCLRGQPSAIPVGRPTFFETVWCGGLLAGLLYGLDAVVSASVRGIHILDLFQYIASGLVGERAAVEGGLATALVGCQLHFMIATAAALVYYLVSLQAPQMVQRPLIAGPIFGLGLFVFMHYVIVPLSAAPRQPAHGSVWFLNMLLAHTLLVGLPIALMARRSARAGSQK